jgi:hypothetical protein
MRKDLRDLGDDARGGGVHSGGRVGPREGLGEGRAPLAADRNGVLDVPRQDRPRIDCRLTCREPSCIASRVRSDRKGSPQRPASGERPGRIGTISPALRTRSPVRPALEHPYHR